MYELKIGKVLTSKSVGSGPSSYEKRIYRAAISQRLRNTAQVTFVGDTDNISLFRTLRTLLVDVIIP
jgi:hypothetical protein